MNVGRNRTTKTFKEVTADFPAKTTRSPLVSLEEIERAKGEQSPLVLLKGPTFVFARLFSPNDTKGWHWGRRSRNGKRIATAALVALGRCKLPSKTQRMVRICVCGPRTMDTDNAYAAVKPLLDSIVRMGWLVDDSPEWCLLQVTQEHTTEHGAKVTIWGPAA